MMLMMTLGSILCNFSIWSIHLLMIHIFENMKMTCSHTCFNHLGMIHYNIHMMTSMHILGVMIHIPLSTLICCE